MALTRRVGGSVDQFINFDWNEKDRFANRHPSSPTDAKKHSSTLHERKHAVNHSEESHPQDVFLRDLFYSFRQVCPELLFRIQFQMLEQTSILLREIVVRFDVGEKRQRHKQQPFQQLDRDDGVKRRRGLLDQLSLFAHWKSSKCECRNP